MTTNGHLLTTCVTIVTNMVIIIGVTMVSIMVSARSPHRLDHVSKQSYDLRAKGGYAVCHARKCDCFELLILKYALAMRINL